MAPEAAVNIAQGSASDARSIPVRRLVISAREGGGRGHIGDVARHPDLR